MKIFISSSNQYQPNNGDELAYTNLTVPDVDSAMEVALALPKKAKRPKRRPRGTNDDFTKGAGYFYLKHFGHSE